jgi:zinc transport system ATP-binding protein
MTIQIKNLSFSFENLSILQNINLDILKGEFIGIIGPNGGGKTTLLKLIMGFLKQTDGQIQTQGKIGYVPQTQKTDRQFPITLQELVLLGALSKTNFWGKYPSDILTKSNELIRFLGLEEHKHKVFGSLSGGLAQRALLARALISDPDILILDEPTSNIDVPSSKVIFELLESLKGKKTIIIVTHDLKTVIEKVDKVLCVEGQLTTFNPKEVCEHFALGLYHTPLIDIPKNHFINLQTPKTTQEEDALSTIQ